MLPQLDCVQWTGYDLSQLAQRRAPGIRSVSNTHSPAALANVYCLTPLISRSSGLFHPRLTMLAYLNDVFTTLDLLDDLFEVHYTFQGVYKHKPGLFRDGGLN